MTKIALVGCGFVADYYMTTLANYPELEIAGVYDRDAQRLKQFCDFYKLPARSSLDDILNDPAIEIVVNLTTPENHFVVNEAALRAGKHVYCEKPLAMAVEEAEIVTALAEEKGLIVCGAPANAYSDAFELARTQLKNGGVGTPRLVYAEMEDGPVFRGNWPEWRSKSGARWPGVHEFEIGCTLEHVGYALSWLIGLFGPVAHVAASSALSFPDKGPGTERLHLAPDFSVGCLTFESGVVARVTCGLAAPHDRSMTVLGDTGTMVVRDLWDNRSPMHLAINGKRSFPQKVANKIEALLGRRLPFRLYWGTKVAYPKKTGPISKLPFYPSQIDFARGIKRQAEAIGTGQRPFYSGRVALHLTELALALNSGWRDYKVRNTFHWPAV